MSQVFQECQEILPTPSVPALLLLLVIHPDLATPDLQVFQLYLGILGHLLYPFLPSLLLLLVSQRFLGDLAGQVFRGNPCHHLSQVVQENPRGQWDQLGHYCLCLLSSQEGQ